MLAPDRRPPCYPTPGHDRSWRSRGGVLVCGLCHPPASEALVAEWINLLDEMLLEDLEESDVTPPVYGSKIPSRGRRTIAEEEQWPSRS